MNRASIIIVILILLLYSIINIIGFNNIPIIYIILASVISIIITIWGLVKYNYFKKNSIYFSLFFIFIMISLFLFLLDLILKGIWPQYNKAMSDSIYLLITLLFFMGIVLGFIGVIKKSHK